MKQLLFVVLIMLVETTLYAQEEKVIPAYWVVETNIHQKNFSIVRLYDANDALVHEVKMEGVYFDVRKPKHKKMLDELLKGYYHRSVITSKRNKTKKSVKLF